MLENFPYLLLLLVVIAGLIMLANKLRVAYPVLLVLAGLAISFIPNLPKVTIDPHLVFIIFLPPLLYQAAFANSFKELWKWRRIIFSFAFVVVFITAAAVALVANLILPGFSLALGFLLGGIVSPPDAVSAAAILRFVKVPRRLSTILEGESLLNDASSLIIFRFAAIVVTAGQFVWYQAAGSFVWMIVGGVGIGLVVAWVLAVLHKKLPTDADMDIMLTLIAPYIMYITAEELGASGVLATVVGGLYISYHRNSIFPATTRVKGIAVWDSFVFILNGLVFALIGLDLPQILEGLQGEGVDLLVATYYGVLITVVLIVVRILSAYGAIVVTQIMKHFIAVADERMPGKATPFVLGWAGMRGVVSLASALSIPLMAGEEAFPHRNLILYITFVVILLTLVVQGLTLPLIIKRTKFPDFDDHMAEAEAETLIRKALAQSALDFMERHYPEDIAQSFLLQNQQGVWQFQLERETCNTTPEIREKYIAILHHQHQTLLLLNKNPHVDEEMIRHFQYQLDLEEEKWTLGEEE